MMRLCSICARGGSVGVKNKNLRPLAGRPLIAHTIEQARASRLFDVVAVSSDDDAILSEARRAGADLTVRRPYELATDTAPKMPAIRHCARAVETETGQHFDVFVDLDATAPLRATADIAGAVAKLEASEAANLVSVSPARHSPYFNMLELDDRGRARLVKRPSTDVSRRQDAPACYDMNASIYVWRRAALLDSDGPVIGEDTLIFEMPRERSLDIDSELDFAVVEVLLARRLASTAQ